MSPYIRGRFIPKIESAGPVKARLDILLWLPQISPHELACLDSIEVLRIYLSSMTPRRCSINFWVPAPFVEAQEGLTAIGIDFEKVEKADPTPKIEAELGVGAPREILEIAATALSVDADVVVTSNPDWYPYAIDFERLNIFLSDCIILKRQSEIFVRGHEIPWSFDHAVCCEPWNGFYLFSEQRTFRAGLDFLNRAQNRNVDRGTQEAAQMLVHNRLSNLCFTRDRLLFFDMQQTVSRRLGWERQEFIFETGYYLNFYYLLLHGGFDHLALVVNGALGLGLARRDVGARYAGYLNVLRERAPEIYALFTDARVLEFLERVSALRHFAAHRGSIAPGKIYEKLDPEPSDADLDAEIARQGLDNFLDVVPTGPVRDAFRATLRQKMLISLSKLLAEGIVFLEIRGKWHYIRPMSDIEWNFEWFHSFMVSVLTALTARI